MKLRRLRNLNLTLELLNLQISVIPFRFARPAFVTQQMFIGRGRSVQLFFGPFHVWHYRERGTLRVGFELSLDGGYHGSENPTGENVFAFLWRRYGKGDRSA